MKLSWSALVGSQSAGIKIEKYYLVLTASRRDRESPCLLCVNLLHKMAAGTKQLTSDTSIENSLLMALFTPILMC